MTEVKLQVQVMGRAGVGPMQSFTLKMGQNFHSGSFFRNKMWFKSHKVERLVFDLFWSGQVVFSGEWEFTCLTFRARPSFLLLESISCDAGRHRQNESYLRMCACTYLCVRSELTVVFCCLWPSYLPSMHLVTINYLEEEMYRAERPNCSGRTVNMWQMCRCNIRNPGETFQNLFLT